MGVAKKPASKPVSLTELKSAIPHHCFQPSTLTTLSYIAQNMFLVTLLWYLMSYIPSIESSQLRFSLWAVSTFLQGLVLTGTWIIAHECGHGALFPSSRANDFFGWALHSLLLVPYFPWKLTHARHHRFTNHLEKDTAFVPKQDKSSTLRWQAHKLFGLAEDSPLLSLVLLLGQQVIGWPSYLIAYVTAGKDSHVEKGHGWLNSHFDPASSLFKPNQRHLVVISDIGIALVLAAVWGMSKIGGVSNVLLAYGVPYLWVNHWIVAITFLHHTHKDVPHYDESTWTYVDGALATVDRDFGFVGRHVFHGIIEFHVIHHLFPRIPFYRAEEATEAIMPLLGDRYKRDSRPFLSSLWKTFHGCTSLQVTGESKGAYFWEDVASSTASLKLR